MFPNTDAFEAGLPLRHLWRVPLGQRSRGTWGRGRGGRDENNKLSKGLDTMLSFGKKVFTQRRQRRWCQMLRGHTVDSWKELQHEIWNDHWSIILSFSPPQCSCYFSFWTDQREKASKAARNWARKQDKSVGVCCCATAWHWSGLLNDDVAVYCLISVQCTASTFHSVLSTLICQLSPPRNLCFQPCDVDTKAIKFPNWAGQKYVTNVCYC